MKNRPVPFVASPMRPRRPPDGIWRGASGVRRALLQSGKAFRYKPERFKHEQTMLLNNYYTGRPDVFNIKGIFIE